MGKSNCAVVVDCWRESRWNTISASKWQNMCGGTKISGISFPPSQLSLLPQDWSQTPSPALLLASLVVRYVKAVCSAWPVWGEAGTGVSAAAPGQEGRVWAGSPEPHLERVRSWSTLMLYKHTHLLGNSCFWFECHGMDGSGVCGFRHFWFNAWKAWVPSWALLDLPKLSCWEPCNGACDNTSCITQVSLW